MAYEYQVVVDDILRRIRKGEWREGDKLPPLAALEKEYPQSRMTLYKALRNLTDRGYLIMARRRGTFVRTTHVRSRIAILTGALIFDMGAAPFVVQAFRYAHAYFSRCGMAAQLYSEDTLSPTASPAGLREEFEQQKLTGLLTVSATFPWRHMLTPEWRAKAIPHVNLGEGNTAYSIGVDHKAFLELALAEAKARGRRRVVLLEREEHAVGHLDFFRQRCAAIGLAVCPLPASMPPTGIGYEEYGYQLLHRVWAASGNAGERPDAAIIPDDVIAKGISQAALALTLSVPDELMMIAMTNRGTHFFYPTPIVSIEVDVESMVAAAAGMLIDLINGVKVPPRAVMVPPIAPMSVAPVPSVQRREARTKSR